MHKFNEDLLQFIWKLKLYGSKDLLSVAGNKITVLSHGEQNRNAGPDFFNARICVNGVTLAGNVEVHLRTSDWLRHGHQFDKNYDNIILHVVYEHDTELQQNRENSVEVLELKEYISPEIVVRYETIANSPTVIPCGKLLKNNTDIRISSWIDRMTVERLELKVRRIEELYKTLDSDLRETFYNMLLRSFGFQVNAVPMETLARSLRSDVLLRHADNPLQVEALLFGTAGFLDQQFESPSIQKLQNEFEFLRSKYRLRPMSSSAFKFSRMRPANFPTIRLQQLATLIAKEPSFIFSIHTYRSLEDLQISLRQSSGSYWSNEDVNPIGKTASESIAINAVVPFLFFYGKKTGINSYCETAISILNGCAAEDNYKTRQFAMNAALNINAAASQGLIHLSDNYCSRKQCLRCGIAAALMKHAEMANFKA
jgi:hypothetical protein